MSDKPESVAKNPRSVRMGEVAARANVSAMTVSRAIRSPDLVSAETLRRVNKVIREMGYVPNQLAGGLKSANRAKLVATVVPSIRNSLFADTLQGLSDTLRVKRINLMIGDSQYFAKEEELLIAAFLAQRPCGIVLHDTTHTAASRRLLREAGIPIVEVGNLKTRPIDQMVSYSNFEAGKTMTEHLIGRGYRNVAFVSQLLAGNERAQERRRGYMMAVAEAGLVVREALMLELEVPGGFESGAAAIVRLLEQTPEVDAVFFAGDVLAIGAVLECQRRGWAIPDRVAIAGFDDWEIGRQLDIPLTALAIPRYQIGRIAAQLILRRLSGEPPEATPIDVGFRLIQRAST